MHTVAVNKCDEQDNRNSCCSKDNPPWLFYPSEKSPSCSCCSNWSIFLLATLFHSSSSAIWVGEYHHHCICPHHFSSLPCWSDHNFILDLALKPELLDKVPLYTFHPWIGGDDAVTMMMMAMVMVTMTMVMMVMDQPHLWAASVLPSKWMKRKLPASQTDPLRKRRIKTWGQTCWWR